MSKPSSMRKQAFKVSIRHLLTIVFLSLVALKSYGQCTTCTQEILLPNIGPITATANGQTICIRGTGTYNGLLDFGFFNNVTICVDETVIIGPGFVAGTTNDTPGNKIISHGVWNRPLGNTLLGTTDFDNYGIVNTSFFNVNNGIIVNNYGALNVIGPGASNLNAGQLILHEGSTMDVDGDFNVASQGDLQLGSILNLKGNLTINDNTTVDGISTSCGGIIMDPTKTFINNDEGTGGSAGISTNKSPDFGHGGIANITINNRNKPVVTQHPRDTFLCEGKTTTFSAAAIGDPGANIQYRWQVRTPSGAYRDLTNTAPYSGVNSRVLTITGASYELDNMNYRVRVTDCPNIVYSNPAALRVHPNPIVKLDYNSSDLFCFKGTRAITVTGTYDNLKWTAPFPRTISEDVTSHIPDTGGIYSVTVTNLLGCVATDFVNVRFDTSLAYFNLGDGQKVVCSNELNPIVIPSGSYTSILWEAPEVVSPGNTMSHNPKTSGQYKVTVSNLNCTISDSVTIDFRNGLDAFDVGDRVFNPCESGGEIVVPPGAYNKITWKAPAPIQIPDDTPRHKPTVKGEYIITVTDGFCTVSDSVYVDFLDTLAIDLGSQSVISCQDNRTQFSVTQGNFVYEWYVNNTRITDSSTFTFTPSRSGMHRVMVYDAAYPECISQDSIQVTYSEDFDFNFSGDSTVSCFGANFELCVENGTNYIWKKEGQVIPHTDNCYAPEESGLYAVLVTDANGCSKEEDIYVIHYNKLNIGLNGKDTASCYPYDVYTIQVNLVDGDRPGASYQYQWVPNVTDQDHYTPVYNGDSIQKFKVTVTNNHGCTDTDSVQVRFPPEVVFNFSGDSTASCFGTNFQLCASGGVKYQWFPAGIVTSETQACFTPSDSGTYGVKAIDQYGCFREESIFVKYYEKLDIGLNGQDTAACFPYDEYTIQVNLRGNGHKYEWTPNVTTEDHYTPVFKGDTVEKYIVKVTNRDGCEDTDSVSVRFVPDPPMPQIDGGDTTACEYVQYTIRPGPGYLRYEWGNNVAGSLDSVFVPTEDGKYWVTVYTKRGGCKKTSDTIDVNFVENRIPDLGPEEVQCKMNPRLILDAGAGYDSYEWENDPSLNKSQYQIPFPAFDGPGITKEIKVKVVYEGVCVTETSKSIRFIQQDSLNIGPADTVCPGTPVYLKVPDIYDFYYWAKSTAPNVPLSETNEVTIVEPGIYALNVGSICGTEMLGKELINYESPKIELGKDTLICLGSGLVLKNRLDQTNASKYNMSWFDANSENELGRNIANFTVNTDGKYYVVATDEHSCISTDTINVTTSNTGECFVLPNLITPNGDGRNDAFFIRGIVPGVWRLMIYNRWGSMVFHSEAYEMDWTAQGLEDGIYFYHLENPTDQVKYNGWINVKGK